MDFVSYLRKGLDIIQLKEKAITDVAKDNDAFVMAIIFIAIGGVASAIGVLQPFAIVTNPIFAVIFAFIWVGVIYLLAMLFGGKGSYMELFRAAGIASMLNWVTIIPVIGPFLGFLTGLWGLVIMVVLLKAIYKLSTGKAVVVVLIPVAVFAVIAIIIAIVAVAFFATMLGAAGLGAANLGM